eukprot:scaffold1954_cov268-Pinguiococcus_pyrenoidosus.AAC.73
MLHFIPALVGFFTYLVGYLSAWWRARCGGRDLALTLRLVAFWRILLKPTGCHLGTSHGPNTCRSGWGTAVSREAEPVARRRRRRKEIGATLCSTIPSHAPRSGTEGAAEKARQRSASLTKGFHSSAARPVMRRSREGSAPASSNAETVAKAGCGLGDCWRPAGQTKPNQGGLAALTAKLLGVHLHLHLPVSIEEYRRKIRIRPTLDRLRAGDAQELDVPVQRGEFLEHAIDNLGALDGILRIMWPQSSFACSFSGEGTETWGKLISFPRT